MGFVEVVDLSLELLNAAPVVRSGQLEPASGGRRGAENRKIVPNRGEAPTDNNEKRPDPLTSAHGVNEHPELEQRQNGQPGVSQPVLDIEQVGDKESQHSR